MDFRFNSFHANGDCFSMLITFANSLDQEIMSGLIWIQTVDTDGVSI